ncbi:hypothetical protein RRG08_000550, partial [Elysia crispata]
MRNVAFTPKGDHIAWTQVPVLYVISANLSGPSSAMRNATFGLVSLAIVLCSFLSMGLIIIPE